MGVPCSTHSKWTLLVFLEIGHDDRQIQSTKFQWKISPNSIVENGYTNMRRIVDVTPHVNEQMSEQILPCGFLHTISSTDETMCDELYSDAHIFYDLQLGFNLDETTSTHRDEPNERTINFKMGLGREGMFEVVLS